MNDAASTRLFYCRKCLRPYTKFAARCPNCDNHAALVTAGKLEMERAAAAPTNHLTNRLTSTPAPTPPTVPPQLPVDFVDDPTPRPITPPRLSIVRAPSPTPDLEDPIEELADVVPPRAPVEEDDDLVPLSDIEETTFVRDSTGLPPLDHVLGGGLVVASVVLLASPPGIGKTSLTLQMLDGLGHRALYVSGEETKEQIKGTARRIGVACKKVYPLIERDVDKILEKARAIRAQTIAIDSIQKMICLDVPSRAGSGSQIKECTARLIDYAKTTATAVWIIGHVTADGDVAGPKTIEHDVDAVLDLETGARYEGNERILRCNGKNRFGPTNVEGRFELTARGFKSIDADDWNEQL